MDFSTRHPASLGKSVAIKATALLLCWAQVLPAWAVPSQVPLLTRSSNSAQPNVMFTFDDSGSMAWRFMPDAIWPQSNAIRWSTTFHPGDTATYGNSGDSDGVHVIPTRPNIRVSSTSTVCSPDTQFTDCRASDLISARMRSSAYNTLYYNPEIRYEPWYNSDGSQYPASPPATAWENPLDRTAGNSVNLIGVQPIPSGTFICRSTTSNLPNAGDRTRTSPTCGPIPDENFAFQAACEATSGAWTGSACRFTSAQSATSGNCTGTFGGNWSTGSGGRCDVSSSHYTNSTRGAAFCNNQVSGGTWINNACRKSTEDFAPATYYEYLGGGFDTSTNYRRVRLMDLPATGISRTATRTDCAVSGSARSCTRDQEYQNFANWFTYYRTRNYLAIAAASRAFSEQGEDLRVGYGRINKASGAVDGVSTATVQRGVRAFSGSDRSSFFSWLHSVPAAGGTPLRRATDDVGKYFQRKDNRGPWANTPGTDDGSGETSHLQCRKSYQILMTDGFWNGDTAQSTIANSNVDNVNGPNITGPNGTSFQYVPARPYRDSTSNTLADVAMYYWNRDLRPDIENRVPPDSKNPAFWQHMVNFTVGLGVGGTLAYPGAFPQLQSGALNWPAATADSATAVDDLWHAAVNSRGEYLSAKDPDEFAASLSSILNEITIRNASEGGVAATAATLQAGNRKYVPEYRTGLWTGNLTAYELDQFGQQLSAVWNAEASLPAHGARNIYAGTRNQTPRARAFTFTDLDAAQKTEIDPSLTANLINYLRGDATFESDTYRQRSSRLGDFVNSQPVFVKGLVNLQYNFLPDSIAGRSSYKSFVSSKASRDGVVFVGGNAGMLHAFRDSDGREVFGFIPRILLPGLSALASPSYGHRYYVDGQLTESDAYLGGAWQNVLLGSNGAGARGVFALNVTNMSAMNANNVMWELDSTIDSEIGYVLAPIEVGVMANGTWVAVFGNGPDSASGRGQLFIVNLSTGAVIKKIPVSTATGNGLGGARLIRDANRVVIGAYAGDLLGNVWKFDLSSNSSTNWGVSFGGQPLFNVGASRPITAPPQFVTHPNGGFMVLVGTGKLYEEGDQINNSQQSLYGLWDQQMLIENTSTGVYEWTTTATPITDASTIVNHSFNSSTVSGSGGETFYTIASQPLNWSIHRGWRLPLTITAGHRNLLSPQFIFGYALFETMAPSAQGVLNPCDTTSNGVAYNLLINPLDGKMPTTPLFDIDGDGVVDPTKDQAVAGILGAWDGRDVVLSQKPCLNPEDCPEEEDEEGNKIKRCPKGTKLISIQGASTGDVKACMTMHTPARWWWRQLQQVPLQ